MFQRPLNQVSKNYDPWYKSMPENCQNTEELIKILIDRANLAPSTHGSAPWKFVIEDQSLSIFPDLNRQLQVSDTSGRQMYISLGAAITNAIIAANYYGFEVIKRDIYHKKDKTLGKKITFKNGFQSNYLDKKLFNSIPLRVTYRGPLLTKPVSLDFNSLVSLKNTPNIEILVAESEKAKKEIGVLVAIGDNRVLSNPAFTHELSQWVRPNHTIAVDGMPGFGFNIDDFDSMQLNKLFLSGILSQIAPARDLDLVIKHTASFGIVSTHEDSVHSWIEAGELYQKITLLATAEGIATPIWAVLIENEDLRNNLQQIIGTGKLPQVMFRMGYLPKDIPPTPHSPRRKINHIIEIGTGEEKGVVDERKPKIFTLKEGTYQLDDLESELKPLVIIDRYSRLIADLTLLNNPSLDLSKEEDRNFIKEIMNKRNTPYDGKWVYYPWKETLVHMLSEEEFNQLYYSRNNPCIDPETNIKLNNLKVGIAGLSVGSNIASALIDIGVLNLTLADLDTLDLSNLSRMEVGDVLNIGEAKTEILSKRLYEKNPYINLNIVEGGVGIFNLPRIINDVDVFIDHMDNLPLKIEARKVARVLGKPILMATDIDKRPIIDIELPSDQEFFAGRPKPELIMDLSKPITNFTDWASKAVKIFGLENTSAAVLENFISVADKKQNYGSQLGLTGFVVAGFLAYYIYEIARGNSQKLLKTRIIPIEQEDLIDHKRKKELLSKFDDKFKI